MSQSEALSNKASITAAEAVHAADKAGQAKILAERVNRNKSSSVTNPEPASEQNSPHSTTPPHANPVAPVPPVPAKRAPVASVGIGSHRSENPDAAPFVSAQPRSAPRSSVGAGAATRPARPSTVPFPSKH